MQAKGGRQNFSKFKRGGVKDKQFGNVKNKKNKNSNYKQSYNQKGRQSGNSQDKQSSNAKYKRIRNPNYEHSHYKGGRQFDNSGKDHFGNMKGKQFGDSNYADKKGRKSNDSQGQEFQFSEEGNYTTLMQKEKDFKYLNSLYGLFKEASDTEKTILAGRILEEIQKEYTQEHYCKRSVAQILEETLHLASYDTLLAFLESFSDDFRVFSFDPFASHVLQALLILCLKYIQKEIEGKTPEELPLNQHKEKMQSFLVQASKFIYNNLDVFVCHTYASFIVRAILEVCSGVMLPKSLVSSNKKKCTTEIDSRQVLEIPEELQELLPNIAHRLLRLIDFPGVISSRQGSAVMQVLLSVLSAKGNTEVISVIVDHIFQAGFDQMNIYMVESTMHPLFENDCTSLLMEMIISSVPQERLKSIWNKYFVKNLDTISCSKPSNFSLQKLLLSWSSKIDFPEIYCEIKNYLHDILATQMTGVILELVKACRRLGSCQKECLMDLKKLLNFSNVYRPKESFIFMLLYLTPLKMFAEKQKRDELYFTLHGSLILQELMNFDNPKEIIEDFLSLTPLQLIKISCDWKACHVIKAFISSDIEYSSKEKFYNKLKGNIVKLACNKYGSRSLEDIWDVVKVNIRSNICEELVNSKSMLAENFFGQIVIKNFELEHFTKRSQSWEKRQQMKCNKRKQLTDLLSNIEHGPPPKKRKKKGKKWL